MSKETQWMPTISESYKAIDMTLLDWFATFAPEPTEDVINREIRKDEISGKIRGNMTIQCDLRYQYAKEMMKAR